MHLPSFDSYQTHNVLIYSHNVLIYSHPIDISLFTQIRFQIDFLNDKNDVYVHINPRFNENVIVRNSYINNTWGQEERSKSIGPLCSSPTFEMMVLFNKQSCSVSSNGVHLFKYFYRMPMDEIEQIAIKGDMDVNSIIVSPNNLQFSGNYIKPIEIRNPKIPFISPLR